MMELGDIQRNTVVENPEIEEAVRLVRAGTSRHRSVIIVGRCVVDYEGRASSHLEGGERIIILKADGSALVHRPREYAPVNWQPPGSIFRTRIDDGVMKIRVFRRKDNEVLEVLFDQVLMVAVLDLSDSGEFYLHASEWDMQRAILAEPSILEEGFRPISSERPVESGFIDILGVDRDNVLTIVELKRKPATKEDVLQLKKYMDVFLAEDCRRIRGILVAPELARGSQQMLASLGLEFVPLSPQRCSEVLKRKSERSITDFFSKG